jgi:hypothetical protein
MGAGLRPHKRRDFRGDGAIFDVLLERPSKAGWAGIEP